MFADVFSFCQIGVPITCFTTLASAQYTANSISVTLTQTNTGVGTCVPSEGLSGGEENKDRKRIVCSDLGERCDCWNRDRSAGGSGVAGCAGHLSAQEARL